VTVRLLTALVVALALAAPAAASEQHPTLPELERELICPACHETLAASSSAIADRIRAFVRQRIAAGDTKSEIKAKLVDQFGEAVLAAPPKSGFALAAAIVGGLAYRWSRRRQGGTRGDPSTNGRFHLDPELERRLDEELARYDG
jgi:cytochrome c-type biogenesis protein CcmH